jgi:hypothetical protein
MNLPSSILLTLVINSSFELLQTYPQPSLLWFSSTGKTMGLWPANMKVECEKLVFGIFIS